MDLPFLYVENFVDKMWECGVSILILMDLPFLLYLLEVGDDAEKSFNPYSNGSSFFIILISIIVTPFNSFQSLF